MHRDVSAQLAVVQQRVAELTPLAEEAAGLRQREAEARRNTEDAERMFQDLLVRVKLDEEAAARVRKEQDELLEKDTDASQWAIELLAELEMEQDLRRKAEERSVAL